MHRLIILFSIFLFMTSIKAEGLIKLVPSSIVDGLSTNKKHMLLDKKSLGKPFLLQVNQITTREVAKHNLYVPKIILFEKKNNKIVMLESPLGRDRTNTVQTKTLLAVFPIKKNNLNTIVFDFNLGMKSIFQRLWMDGSLPENQQGGTTLSIEMSYLNQLRHKGEVSHIDQILRVTYQGQSYGMQVQYTFSPYKKNPHFKPTKGNNNNRFALFETPIIADAKTSKKFVNVIKIDHNKPRIYYLANNAPEYVIEAVKDGLDYWNHVFGKRIFKLEIMKDSEEYAPNINTIHWINYDSSDAAYAHNSFDPLTGETLQHHIYIPSAFKKIGDSNLKFFLDEAKIALTGFQQTKHRCDQGQHSSHHNSEKINLFTDPNLLNEMTADSIRKTIAHEVGHNLGLRHNFAGNIYSNIDIEKKSEILNKYFTTLEVDSSLLPTSTVMDYLNEEESALAGRLIKNKVTFPYDKMVVDWLYYDKPIGDKKIPFCTDQDIGQFSNCNQGDSGKHQHLELKKRFLKSVNNAAYYYIRHFYGYNKKDSNFKEFNPISLSPEGYGGSLTNSLKSLLKIFRNNATFVELRLEFHDVSSFNRDEYKTVLTSLKKQKYKEIKLFKELEAFLEKGYLSDLWLKSYNRLRRTTLNYSANSLSPDLLDYMESNAKEYFRMLERYFIEELASSFNMVSVYQGLPIEELEDFTFKLANHLLFTKSSNIIAGKINDKTYHFTKPYYSIESRRSILSLLRSNNRVLGYNDFSVKNYSIIKKKLDESLKDYDIDKMPRNLKSTIQEEKNLN